MKHGKCENQGNPKAIQRHSKGNPRVSSVSKARVGVTAILTLVDLSFVLKAAVWKSAKCVRRTFTMAGTSWKKSCYPNTEQVNPWLDMFGVFPSPIHICQDRLKDCMGRPTTTCKLLSICVCKLYIYMRIHDFMYDWDMWFCDILCMYYMPCLANDFCTSTQLEASTVRFKKTTRHPEQGRCTCAVNIVYNKVTLALYAYNPSSSFSLKDYCHECSQPCPAFRAQSCLMRCTLPNTFKKRLAKGRGANRSVP